MTAALAIHSGPLTAHLPPNAAAVFGMGLDQDPLPGPTLTPLRLVSTGSVAESVAVSHGAWSKEGQCVNMVSQTEMLGQSARTGQSDLDLSGFNTVGMDFEDWMCDSVSVPSLTASVQSSPDEQDDPFLAAGLIFGDEPTLGVCNDLFLGEPPLDGSVEDIGDSSENPELWPMIDKEVGVTVETLGLDEPFVLVRKADVDGVGNLIMDGHIETKNSHTAKEVLPSER